MATSKTHGSARGGAIAGARAANAVGPGAPRAIRILSSAHLAEGGWPELSELEFGLIVCGNAFARWTTRCMAAAGAPELTSTDILVLHHVEHRRRAKKLADICFTLNYEDTHVVKYSLKKLVGMRLIDSHRSGKEVFYSSSETGRKLVARYRDVREQCLLPSLAGEVADSAELVELACTLRTLSGLYDQAARAATSL